MTVERTGERRVGATITDVALRAGVAVSTVSKALNGRGQLREETRKRVMAAATDLEYSPSPIARGLQSGRSYSVGLVTSDRVGRFSVPVLAGVEDALGAGEILVYLCDARGDAGREERYVRALLARKVDGIIVTAERTDPRPALRLPPGVPVVYAYCRSERPHDPAVLPDDVAAGALATRHLVARGRRRIAHVAGPAWAASRERASGVVAELASAGLQLAGGEVLDGDWSEAWGRTAVGELLQRAPDLDAVVVSSDQIARGVVDGLLGAGRRVPEDVAVAGCDNWAALAEGGPVPLTSVDLDLEQVGRVAARTLLAAVDGSAGSGHQLVAPSLVVRSSSGPAC